MNNLISRVTFLSPAFLHLSNLLSGCEHSVGRQYLIMLIRNSHMLLRAFESPVLSSRFIVFPRPPKKSGLGRSSRTVIHVEPQILLAFVTFWASTLLGIARQDRSEDGGIPT